MGQNDMQKLDIALIKQLIKNKCEKHWEWKATSRIGSSSHHALDIWIDASGKQKGVVIRILSSLESIGENETWSCAVEYKGVVGPRSMPNKVRCQAAMEALKLWWDGQSSSKKAK